MSNSPDLQPHRQNAAEFLMGGSVPSASFLKIGASCAGVICDEPVVQQQRDMTSGLPKTWDDGNPMMQLVVTLQTEERDAGIDEDDGRRRIYVKFNMKTAIADAVRKAGKKALEAGGRLTVTYIHDGEVTKRGFNPPKFYSATYAPPAANFLAPDKHDEAPGAPGAPAAAWTFQQAVDQYNRTASPAAAWTFQQAVDQYMAVGGYADTFKANLKAKGFVKWDDAAKEFARSLIAEQIGGGDDQPIPF